MLQDVAIHFKALFAGDLSFSSDGGSSWASDIDIKEGTAGEIFRLTLSTAVLWVEWQDQCSKSKERAHYFWLSSQLNNSFKDPLFAVTAGAFEAKFCSQTPPTL